jgi:hypothetical protein
MQGPVTVNPAPTLLNRCAHSRSRHEEEMMQRDPNHPSQAEGEDPERSDGGFVEPQEGHPSQAEGEDPNAPEASKGEVR